MPATMPAVRIAEIIEAVGGEYSGDQDRVIHGVRTLSDAGPDDLTFLSNPKYESQVTATRASAIFVKRDYQGEVDEGRLIRVDDPYLALSIVLSRWFGDVPRPSGISPEASISSSARLGEDVSIGARAVVGDDVTLGDGVTVYPGAVIGAGCDIGSGTTIYANATLYHRTRVGERCIIHSGTVIGGDGFGFATAGGKHNKLPQIGIVRIENDVEIGAGTTIDRAALGETLIGEGTKIDNLVMVGHNVKIGKHCLIVAGVAFAGSSEIGDYCVLAGHAGVAGHVRLGSRVMVAAKAAVMKDWDGPVTLAGNPARPIREKMRADALVRRIPAISARLEKLERERADSPAANQEKDVSS